MSKKKPAAGRTGRPGKKNLELLEKYVQDESITENKPEEIKPRITKTDQEDDNV